MTNIEEIKNVIKSRKYRVVNYTMNYDGYNEFSHKKRVTKIDFNYYSYNKIIFCYITFYKNIKYTNTLRINIKLK